MKKILIFIFVFSVIAVATALGSCSGHNDVPTDIEQAEEAYALGMYNQAQQLCDSIAARPGYLELDVQQLCRLSLLFMRLSDRGADIDANTAMAARALTRALELNADSTIAYIDAMPVEDRACMTIIRGIHEGRHTEADTAYIFSYPDEEGPNMDGPDSL